MRRGVCALVHRMRSGCLTQGPACAHRPPPTAHGSGCKRFTDLLEADFVLPEEPLAALILACPAVDAIAHRTRHGCLTQGLACHSAFMVWRDRPHCRSSHCFAKSREHLVQVLLLIASRSKVPIALLLVLVLLLLLLLLLLWLVLVFIDVLNVGVLSGAVVDEMGGMQFIMARGTDVALRDGLQLVLGELAVLDPAVVVLDRFRVLPKRLELGRALRKVSIGAVLAELACAGADETNPLGGSWSGSNLTLVLVLV